MCKFLEKEDPQEPQGYMCMYIYIYLYMYRDYKGGVGIFIEDGEGIF